MSVERPLRIDLHTHTHYSPDSIASPERLVAACRRKGITCLAVTDHNTMRGVEAVKDRRGTEASRFRGVQSMMELSVECCDGRRKMHDPWKRRCVRY